MQYSKNTIKRQYAKKTVVTRTEIIILLSEVQIHVYKSLEWMQTKSTYILNKNTFYLVTDI